MLLQKISFENYRNLSFNELTFSDGVNVLLGDNAQGKTNVIEGIYNFAAGRSFRGAKDRELIRFGEECAKSTLWFCDPEGDVETLEIRYAQNAPKVMRKNGVMIRKLSDFVGNFRAVLFCPEHLSLIKGPAAGRRGYLDMAVSQLRPAYLHALLEYGKILKQRNSLLKNDDKTFMEVRPLLEVLTEQMAPYFAQIVKTRIGYLDVVREEVRDFLCDLTKGGETVSLFYECLGERTESDGAEKDLLERLFLEKSAKSYEADFRAGQTLVGCHRDDFSIFVNGHEARQYCSQGQDRSLVLALKLAEGEIAKSASGEYPVFLFDDVLSELDRQRQEYLLFHIRDRQVILSACWDDGSFEKMENVSVVEKGNVRKRVMKQ